MIKTSPDEGHTGNPAPRSTSLLNRILVGRRDDDKQPRLQQAYFMGFIVGSDEVIAASTLRRSNSAITVSGVLSRICAS